MHTHTHSWSVRGKHKLVCVPVDSYVLKCLHALLFSMLSSYYSRLMEMSLLTNCHPHARHTAARTLMRPFALPPSSLLSSLKQGSKPRHPPHLSHVCTHAYTHKNSSLYLQAQTHIYVVLLVLRVDWTQTPSVLGMVRLDVVRPLVKMLCFVSRSHCVWLFFSSALTSGVCWLGLEWILTGMHSDWTRQQSFSDWLFVPRLPFWGLLWISASPSPPFLFAVLFSFLSTLYLVDCRRLSVWCECVWLAKTEPAVGSSVFLLMEWYSMQGSLPIVTLCDKWSVKLGLINKMSKNYYIWQMWWGRFETPATDTFSQMHCWPSRECLIEMDRIWRSSFEPDSPLCENVGFFFKFFHNIHRELRRMFTVSDLCESLTFQARWFNLIDFMKNEKKDPGLDKLKWMAGWMKKRWLLF